MGAGGWDPFAMALSCLAVCAVLCSAIFAGEIGDAVKRWRRRR